MSPGDVPIDEISLRIVKTEAGCDNLDNFWSHPDLMTVKGRVYNMQVTIALLISVTYTYFGA